jgi:hypothetical protein
MILKTTVIDFDQPVMGETVMSATLAASRYDPIYLDFMRNLLCSSVNTHQVIKKKKSPSARAQQRPQRARHLEKKKKPVQGIRKWYR